MPKTVLIVEDYADVRVMMKILVNRYGYEVMEAADGYEAVEKAKKQRPDLILMDLSMPLMDGFMATKIIRSFDGFDAIPILALTAYGNTSYHRALQAGCTDLIDKPLDFNALESLLKKYLEQ